MSDPTSHSEGAAVEPGSNTAANPAMIPTSPAELGLRRQFILDLKTNVWAVVSLITLVGVLYAPIVGYEFLNLDDPFYVVHNDIIKSWHPLNLWRVLTEPVARNFAPLTIATFLVEHTLWGLNAGGYHATNLVLHAINAILVFALMRQLTKNNWTAWIVSALFAVHPLQIESVAWVASRKTLLSSMFMLLSGICYLRPQRTGRDEAWGLLWLALGLLSKASCVVVPPIVVVYDVLVARKTLTESTGRQVVPVFLCVLLTYITMSAQFTVGGGLRGHLELNKLEIIGVDATLMIRYLAMLAVPRGLCVFYDPPFRGIGPQIAAALLAWGGLAAFLWVKREKYPQFAFALATWLWLLFPVMNFFPITTLMNDRYMYLPCLVVFTLVAVVCRRCGEWMLSGWQASPLKRQVSLATTATLSIAIVGASMGVSMNYLPVWRNPRTLWDHARQQTPSLPIVHINWADALYRSGDVQGALEALEVAAQHPKLDEGNVKNIESLRKEWSAELALPDSDVKRP
jgi:protein O-mannosyl-transferase